MFDKKDKGSLLAVGKFLELKNSEEGAEFEGYGRVSILCDLVNLLLVYLYVSITHIGSRFSCFSALDDASAEPVRIFLMLAVLFFAIFSLLTLVYQNLLNKRAIGQKAIFGFIGVVAVAVVLNMMMSA